MVECTALEMRHTGNRIGGSNPSLSAKFRSNLTLAREAGVWMTLGRRTDSDLT